MPSIQDMKAEARALRLGDDMSHSAALEAVAKRHGFRNWNAASALAEEGAPRLKLTLGQRVRGAYLGREFSARVMDAVAMGEAGWVRVGLDLDEPLSVSDIEGLNVVRRRLRGNLGPDGETAERITGGVAQLKIYLE